MKYNIVITAGGTSEKIDNVRKITNSSSGKLGQIIANKLLEIEGNNINKIFYVCSKTACKPCNEKVEIIQISSCLELEKEIKRLLLESNIHYFIHSMAVSDYMVDYVSTVENLALNINQTGNIFSSLLEPNNVLTNSKISSNEENLIIKLKKNPKIISIIKNLSPKTYLVGFKLLDSVSEDFLIETAIKLKEKNNCNLVVANDLQSVKQGQHKAFIIESENKYITAFGKEDIATKLINKVFNKGE